MMSRMHTWPILLLTALLALTLAAAPVRAEGGFGEEGKSVQELFDEFRTFYFVEELYDAACQFLNAHPGIRELAGAKDYIMYLDAVVYMDEGRYDEALILFETLKSKAEPFHNSETMYNYCSGRVAEAEWNYEEAITCYSLAYAYGDAQKRMLDCHKLVRAEDDVYSDIYLNALTYMENEEFKYAAMLFEILKNQAPQFYYCEQMFNYCSGRDAEAAGNYMAAITFYQNAATYEHAWKRIEGCLEKMNAAEDEKAAARIAEADEMYQRGVSRQDADTLRQARALYDELGEKDKANRCTEQIALIEKQQAYDAAMSQYNTAVATDNIAGLKLARSAFTALGDYADSKALVETITALVETMERKLSIASTTADSASITLSWSDTSADDCTYAITWATQNAPHTTTVTTTARQYTLTGLLPGTAYEITVAPENLPGLAQTITFSTMHAPVYTENGFQMSDASVYSVSRTILKRLSVEAAFTSASVQVHEGNRLTLEAVNMAFQPRVYAYYISYSLTDEPAGAVSHQLVLRTKSAGTYATDVTEGTTLNAPWGRFYLMLEPLLDSVYAACGEWPEETCTIEMYIDGCLAAKGTLTLGK